MNRDMICCWLGLADKCWPPDPYALLGLSPNECDAPKIEKRVQERMAKLRCYQLCQPDEATEGMNRVAQAFITLVERHCPRAKPCPSSGRSIISTDPAALPLQEPTKPAQAPRTVGDTAVAQDTHLDWQATPPPIRTARTTPLPAIPVEQPAPVSWTAVTPAEDSSASIETEQQLIRNLAEESDEARGGLLELQLVIERVRLTRHLLIAWRRAGRYLGNPKRKISRAVDKKNFTQGLEALLDAADRFPEFLAHPGRPGYRAAAIARLEIAPEVFNAMTEEEREQLAKDWTLAHQVLLAHRVFLLRQFKSLRRRGRFGRAAHLMCTSICEHPLKWGIFGAVVGGIACILVGILCLG